MKTKRGAWVAAAMALALLLGVAGCVFASGTEELSQDLVQNPEDGTYTSLFFSEAEDVGVVVADAFLVVGCWENLCTISLDIWHEEGTVVDEISLEFDPLQPYDALALQTPGGYPWPLAQFQHTPSGVIYSIPDLGFQGTGTMRFEFLLGSDALLSVDSAADQVCLHIDFSMHKGGTWNRTIQHGEGTICFLIP